MGHLFAKAQLLNVNNEGVTAWGEMGTFGPPRYGEKSKKFSRPKSFFTMFLHRIPFT